MQKALDGFSLPISHRLLVVVAIAAIAALAVACRGGGSNPSSDDGLPFIEPTLSQTSCIDGSQPEGAPQFADIDMSRFIEQEEGLRYYDIVEGTGPTPSILDAVSVEYTGWLSTGCMFDTSYINEGTVNFPLVNVIRGWQQGFSTMQVGGTRVIEIGPELGYGTVGFPPRIPGNATLIFHVELLNRVTIEEAQATVEAEKAEATAQAEQASETATADAG